MESLNWLMCVCVCTCVNLCVCVSFFHFHHCLQVPCFFLSRLAILGNDFFAFRYNLTILHRQFNEFLVYFFSSCYSCVFVLVLFLLRSSFGKQINGSFANKYKAEENKKSFSVFKFTKRSFQVHVILHAQRLKR